MRKIGADGPPWHPGELEVQKRAGVGQVSGGGIRSSLPPAAMQFIAEQRVVVLGSVDREGRTWASLRTGDPGFLQALDPLTVQTAPVEVHGDPLLENLRQNPHVGVIVIDFETRRRMRLNGEARVLANRGLLIWPHQVYANCPQYIQERAPQPLEPVSSKTALLSRGAQLTPDQHQFIAQADTLFIASAHPDYGVDASHRGGNPGFVNVESPTRLRIPDYSGNRMFNTLGNISVNPAVGLVFPDFQRGCTLQLSGRAVIDWHPVGLPGTERALVFDIESVIEIEQPALRSFVFRGYSRFNPPL